MPIMPNMTDAVNWSLYDRVVTAAGANTLPLYVFYSIPMNTGGKTKNDTNLEQVQRLPDPEWMNVTHLGFYFTGNMVKADIDNFINSYYMEFWVGQKIYAEGPLVKFPAGVGITGATTRNNEGAWTNGVPMNTNMTDLRLPLGIANSDGYTGITILQGQQFQVRLIGTAFALSAAAAPNNGTGLNLMCFADGIKSRGVQ